LWSPLQSKRGYIRRLMDRKVTISFKEIVEGVINPLLRCVDRVRKKLEDDIVK